MTGPAEGQRPADAGLAAAVLASVPVCIVGLDDGGVVRLITPTAAALLGGDPATVVGRPLAELANLTGPGGAPLDLSAGSESLSSPAAQMATLRVGAGPASAVAVSISPLAGGGAVVVLTPLTPQPPADEAFLALVSHSLRTPLTPIRGYAEILRRHPDLAPDKIASYADTILASTLRLARVIDLVVDLAAVESGRAGVSERPVPVGSLLEERLATWQGRGAERAADFGVEAPTQLGRVHVDPVWVARILDELVDNAVRFSRPGTAVVLTARSDPAAGVVRVGVRDAGAGLDPVLVAALLADGPGEAASGLGIGLTAVRRLARRLRLPLWVLPAAGGGTEVGLELPVAAG
ncbi:MAG: hypothetical protein NVSMB13_21960 [Mycobacteriales bacterium]